MSSVNETDMAEGKDLAAVDDGTAKKGVDSDDMNMETDAALQAQPVTAVEAAGETADDDEDKFKPEGTVVLKIDHFSEFGRAVGSPPNENPQRLSEPVYIRGLPWKILAISRDNQTVRMPTNRRNEEGGGGSRTLGFFLQCNGEAIDTTWTCQASATLSIVSQKKGVLDNSRKITHIYHSKENDWGYSQFITCDTLTEESGFRLNDTVILKAIVCADAPHGVQWDSKKHTGHIGLKNQGATCYMNSILQTLFFTNKLRKAVYQMPTEEDDTEKSVALAMQRVFYELQFSEQPVGTKKLTKSFGWDSVESFLQHDVQELCRVLLDNLETKMKNTAVDGTIPALFAGKMKSYIKCEDVAFESSREESYYDVQLHVKGNANVTDSFRHYTSPETLDGDNKYDAGEHGLQRAQKGVKFISFPPVLTLQLMRFQYEVTMDSNMKVNDRFEFPEELNLDEFIDEDGEPNDYTYVLYAVLVHTGDFHGGHYVVFINTNANGKKHKWCKFDDDVVSRAAVRDAVYANFGGEDPDVICRAFTSAYMLVYVRKNAMDDVLSEVSAADIPEHLKVRFENERKREVQRKREKEEAALCCDISVITDEDLKAYTGFDLFDIKDLEKHPRKLKVAKRMAISHLYDVIAENCKLDRSTFRLWTCSDYQPEEKYSSYNIKRDNYPHDVIRPKYLLKDDKSPDSDLADMVENDLIIYVEIAKPDSVTGVIRLPPLDVETDYMVFLKLYDPERNVTEYKGNVVLHSGNDMTSQLPKINALLGLPPDTRLNVYSELRPDTIFPCRMQLLVRDEPRFADGAILVVEDADRVNADHNADAYFKNLFNRIGVEAIANQEGFGAPVFCPGEIHAPIRGIIGLDWSQKRVAEWIGKQIDFDPARILLWKVSQHNDKPTNYLTESSLICRDILSLNNYNYYDPRVGRLFKIFYTRMPIPVTEMEQRRPMRISAVLEKFQTMEMSIFPPRAGTVQDLLNEVAADFPFSPKGTRQLRLVHASTTANCIRVFQVLARETLLHDIMNRYVNSFLRVEEIPHDQLEVGANEHLLPVAHYDKEPQRMFGVPFFIKVTDGERIGEIRRRIKELLEVSDREFEKYKFCIVMGTRIVRELDPEDENGVVTLHEILATHLSAPGAPFLGIDHMNKSRGARGGHGTEKAIVIHN